MPMMRTRSRKKSNYSTISTAHSTKHTENFVYAKQKAKSGEKTSFESVGDGKMFRIRRAVSQSERFRCRLAPPRRTILRSFVFRSVGGGDYVNSFQSFHCDSWGVADGWQRPTGKSESRLGWKCRGKQEPEVRCVSQRIFPNFIPQ